MYSNRSGKRTTQSNPDDRLRNGFRQTLPSLNLRWALPSNDCTIFRVLLVIERREADSRNSGASDQTDDVRQNYQAQP